jgi:hypothetical protein
MPPADNAPAAPAPGGDNTPPPAPAPDPNDPNTEMSAEDEAAFVDRQLGITDSGAPFAVTPGEEAKKDGGEDDEKAEPKPGDNTPPDPNPDDKKPDEDAGKPADEEPETPPAKEDKPASEAPQEVDTTDLWVELTDANGKEFKIGVNDPIPEDLVFKNDAQLAELTEARMEMKGTLRERQAEYEKSKADAESKDNEAKTEEQQLAAWDTEIQDLIGAGLIEAPKAKPGDKDFLQDASVQKIDAVFKFMGVQNAERAKANKPPITSFGTAYTLWSNDKAKKDAEEAQNKSNETAKARGALVGGSSSSSSGGGNQNLYTQGSAGSIHDLDFSDLE